MTQVRRSRWLALAGAVGLLAILALESCSSIPSDYFRVTAHLIHGDEPVTLDWVVECRYRQNVGDAVGVRAFKNPYVFGVATRDGGMVLMVAPEACGQRQVVRDNLPFFMWGDKAGDFGFFTAYVTREAFANPSAQIKVLDVEIRPSDRAEYDRWAETAPKNVVPDHPDPFRQDARGVASECLGLVEVSIPATFAEEVHRLRPAGEPLYWVAQEDFGIAIAVARHSFINDPAHNPLSEGSGLDAMKAYRDVRVYPFGDRASFERLFGRGDPPDESATTHLRVDLDRPGMMSCAAMPFNTRPRGLAAFDFPDGSAPATPIKLYSNTPVIRVDNTLFTQSRITFDIEQGHEENE